MREFVEPPIPPAAPVTLTCLGGASSDAVVFGASGAIGSELVRQLASCPEISRVFATSRRPRSLGSRLEEVDAAKGRVVALAFDPADEDSVRCFGEALRAHDAQPRFVVWAGGLLHHPEIDRLPERRLAHVTLRGLQETFSANAFGPLLALREIVPLLPRSQPARLGLLTARVGSISDNRLGGWLSYRASKAAAHQIIRTSSIELARSHRETVLVGLHPGTVASRLSRPFHRNVRHEIFAPDATARRLLELLDACEPADHGQIFAWDGSSIPW